MTRKAFILWGLAQIHVQILALAILQYLLISRVITTENATPVLTTSIIMLSIVITLGFAILLWKKLESTKVRKAGILALCLLFIIASTKAVSLLVAPYIETSFYTNTADQLFSDMKAISAFFEAGGTGSPWSVGQRLAYVAVHIPVLYFSMWGFFALLALGCIEPKHPNSIWQKLKRLIKTKTLNIANKGLLAHV